MTSLEMLVAMLRRQPWLRRIYQKKLLYLSGLLFVCGLIATTAVVRVYAQEPSPEFDLNQVTPPDSPPVALAGQAIYGESCAPCHGAQGMGDGPTAAQLPGPPTVFADPAAVWERSPAQLFHTTKFGRIEKLMPPWQNRLDDRQIWQAVAYAWSLHTNQAEIDTGAELYAQSCAACHGPQGAGDGPEAPVDLVDFTDLPYAMARSQADWQAGWQAAHGDLGSEWSPDQQRIVLETIRTFSYTPPWADAYRAGTGVITGTVTQGTPDGSAVTGLTVTLQAYIDFSPVKVLTTTVDTTGAFAFRELDTNAAIAYFVTVMFTDVQYSSPNLAFAPDQPALQTAMTVYETTDDPANVYLAQVHWIIDPRPGAIGIFEVYNFGNRGDRTVVGKTVEGIEIPVTVAVPVPPDAQELAMENGVLGGRFQQLDNLVYDTTPIVPGPGTDQVIMRYFIVNESEALDLVQSLRYPAEQMNLLVTELPQLQVEIAGFSINRTETIQGQNYQLWQPDGAIPAEITMRLSGLLLEGDADPRTAQDNAGQAGGTATSVIVPILEPWAPWVVAIVVVMVLAGVVGWSWQQQRAGGRDRLQDLRAQHDDLIQRIAHLDDRHAIQEIDNDAWQRERAQLKAQLFHVTGLFAQSAKSNTE